MSTIDALLIALRAANTADDRGGMLKQDIFPPEREDMQKVPTLCPGVYLPISPMLQARFRFAGRWVNAAYGHTWLGLSDMESAWNDDAALEQLETRKNYWEGHLLQFADWRKITLFGINRLQNEETLLYWDALGEPAIFTYVGHDHEKYDNLESFLVTLTQSQS